MAQHIMAVCVVCLLCADHLPCQQHPNELMPNAAAATVKTLGYTIGSDRHEHDLKLNARVYRHTRNANDDIGRHTRTRRHAGGHALHTANDEHHYHLHEQHQMAPELTRDFLQRLFDEYGGRAIDEAATDVVDGDIAQTLNVSQFQSILRQLGLLHLIDGQHPNSSTCVRDEQLVHHVQPHHAHTHEHIDGGAVGSGHADAEHNATKCALGLNAAAPCASDAAKTPTHSSTHNSNNGGNATRQGDGVAAAAYTLTKNDMLNLCPILLYQLASGTELKRAGCIDSSVLSELDNLEIKQYTEEKENIIYVWIYAFISVFACSILGLVGVAIIPFMDSRYYKHIIQFLVSLAVGTMTGDAVLHLLPHSLAGQTERNMIFKGLTCMGGIIFFYMTEHGLTMIAEWRKSIAKKEPVKQPTRGVKVMREPDASMNNSVGGGAGDKLCKSKYSSYPYCYDEIAMDSKADVWMHEPNKVSSNANDRKRNGKAEAVCGEMAAQSLLSTSQNNYAPMTDMANCHPLNDHQHHNDHHNSHQNMPDSNTISTDLDGNSVQDVIMPDGGATINGNTHTQSGGGGSGGTGNKESGGGGGGKPSSASSNVSDTVMVILREHESTHHGHSHKHGHVHSPPETLSAVAWMIIMGDGLHNFTDGMAIGAAFADNIAGGFSTSLAVFCHELPHELGDFAILIKAGMTVKSAVYYNLLTGVLSFIGMIFGIVFGQTQETAQWMFAAAAGLFIYIALVDMMPELSSAHKSIQQFVLQVLGMVSGVLVMLCIAIYEDDLMNVFSTSTNVH